MDYLNVPQELVDATVKLVPETSTEVLVHSYKCYISQKETKVKVKLDRLIKAIEKELAKRNKPIKEETPKEQEVDMYETTTEVSDEE